MLKDNRDVDLGSAWEDVTSASPANSNIVSGTLSSLAPVVAAVKLKSNE